jgi:hypothetical protein
MLGLLACAGLAFVACSAVVVAQTAPIDCQDTKECRELALDARARGAYEVFHNLAWRAVQTGRANDPDLMYLLARAQALSGRRRDALVMLRRLAEAGIANDAATHEDFRHVREHAEWPYVAGLAARARPVADATPAPAPAVVIPSPKTPAAAPAVVIPPPKTPAAAPAVVIPPPKTPAAAPAVVIPPPKTPAAAPAVVTTPPKAPSAAPAPPAGSSALRVERADVHEAARFSTRPFVPGGVAHDAVSRRLLFGDVTGRRLFVVGEGSDRPIDLVRADSAGFDDVTAIAVDGKRGDLWVASSGARGSGGALHRLQLISGRALTKVPVPGQELMRLSDMAVSADGTVVILDAATPRVFVRRQGAPTVDLLMPLMAPNPVSITVSDDGRVAYVAHREGIMRIDVPSRRAAALGGAKDITLAGFEFVRWHRDALIGRQAQPDGSRGLVRLRLNRGRDAVSQATLLDDPAPGDGDALSATVSGDDLYYLVVEGSGDRAAGSSVSDVRVKRVTLR